MMAAAFVSQEAHHSDLRGVGPDVDVDEEVTFRSSSSRGGEATTLQSSLLGAGQGVLTSSSSTPSSSSASAVDERGGVSEDAAFPPTRVHQRATKHDLQWSMWQGDGVHRSKVPQMIEKMREQGLQPGMRSRVLNLKEVRATAR
jgi:hypothetical protein